MRPVVLLTMHSEMSCMPEWNPTRTRSPLHVATNIHDTGPQIMCSSQSETFICV